MSVTNGERLVTKQDLADFYNDIRPYMGGLVSSKAGFTPIGTIISVMGTTAPANYLACDGTVYNIADYVELANYFNEQFGSKNFFGGDGTTTFAVPDLRGEFLRGTGTNSHENQGSGASVGVHQDATESPNIGVNTTTQKALFTLSDSGSVMTQKADGTIVEATTKGLQTVKNSMSTTWDGAGGISRYTSRPTNTSVLYCIATKNFYIDPTLDYSTDEKIVGTWIDGKPLYQKTIVTTTPEAAQSGTAGKYVDIGVDIDFGKIVSFEILDGASILPMPYFKNDLSAFVKGYLYNHNYTAHPNTIVINCNSWYEKTCYVTIQYTKTT